MYIVSKINVFKVKNLYIHLHKFVESIFILVFIFFRNYIYHHRKIVTITYFMFIL